MIATHIFRGCIPALMTPCTSERLPDFDALVSKGKELIDVGMAAVVYCGSMGDWPLLTDEQRHEGVERLAVTSRKNVRLFLEQLRFDFVPVLHGLQWRLAAKG